MEYSQVIQAIKKSQYETLKNVMANSKPMRRVPARVGLNKSQKKQFIKRMQELGEKFYFWTESDPDFSDKQLADDRETDGFRIYINFPIASTDREKMDAYEHCRIMVNDLIHHGLTAVWHGNQGRAIELVIGLDYRAASALKIQCAEFDELMEH